MLSVVLLLASNSFYWYAVSFIFTALSVSQVHKIEKVIKEQDILLIMPVFAVGCIWGIALSSFHYVFFILLMIAEEIVYVAMSDYINKMIPSENRATILSFASMGFSLFIIILFPVMGLLGDNYSLNSAIIFLGGLGSLLVLINSAVSAGK